MADPYRNYQTGDKPPRDARTFSAFAAGARLARDVANATGSAEALGYRQGSIIKVKNESGGDLPRCSILALSDPIFLPDTDEGELAFLREVCFRGVTPSTGDAGKYAITLDPIADDSIGRAYIAGVCQVQVDVIDSADTHAEVGTSTSALDSGTSGSALILWREGGTGVQWAVVRFGIVCGTGAYY